MRTEVTERNGIRRGRDGRFAVRLPEHERSVLLSLPAQIEAMAKAGDDATRRLFPPAYTDDFDAESEYARLMRPELMDKLSATLAVFSRTISSESISEDEALDWMRAVNALRLVIGTKIDVQENEVYPDPETVDIEDVRAQGLLLYGYLTWLESELLGAITQSVAT